jgi:hypothetical protein
MRRFVSSLPRVLANVSWELRIRIEWLRAGAKFRLEIRDGLVEVARVDRSEHSAQRLGAKTFGGDRPDESCVRSVHGLEAMVVVNPGREEPAHPVPSLRRLEDPHPKRRTNTARKAEPPAGGVRKRSRRVEHDPFDVPRPRRPPLNLRQVIPRALKRNLDRELATDKLDHSAIMPHSSTADYTTPTHPSVRKCTQSRPTRSAFLKEWGRVKGVRAGRSFSLSLRGRARSMVVVVWGCVDAPGLG